MNTIFWSRPALSARARHRTRRRVVDAHEIRILRQQSARLPVVGVASSRPHASPRRDSRQHFLQHAGEAQLAFLVRAIAQLPASIAILPLRLPMNRASR
jgi:hypothetical protein